ncbi:MAG: type IV toxin-antitoxin system AbiEi family antitoxin [Bifidobacteriaceae bacterium]|jgi:predicted transcriptional regulator of viral defense system|nr:type IV toxin-antitoxin system AbiEi family antitoxin [Bifidobacteriaceae bacterium]
MEQITAMTSADWCLSNGISSITVSELSDMLGKLIKNTRLTLNRLSKRGQWLNLGKGLWAPVPAEYRLQKTLPAPDIVAEIMNYRKLPYYIGWLSAASFHGAHHNAPQVYQIATNKEIRKQKIGTHSFKFYTREHVERLPKSAFRVRSGNAMYSSKEVTLLDVATDVNMCGGINNVGNVIVELTERNVDYVALMEILDYYPATSLKRIGYTLDKFGYTRTHARVSKRLHREIDADSASVLVPGNERTGKFNKKWGIIINENMELDI